jgi:3-hydroxyacyl-CoA dehydrogenase
LLICRNGLNIITKSLSRVAKKASPNDIEGFTKKIMANISTTTDAYVSSSPCHAFRSLPAYALTIRAEAVKESDLVVEAIIESLKVKGDLFGFLDGKAKYVDGHCRFCAW